MSESKRRRKSKHEVREFDVEEPKNTILQTSPHENPDLEVTECLDHTYARYQPMPAMQLSIKVEVEELDEAIAHSSFEHDELYSKLNKDNNGFFFELNLEKMYRITERIQQTTDNPADKHLSVDLKNIWGRALKPEVYSNPYNDMIQDALCKWAFATKYTNGKHCFKDPPLFYQCLICKLAWWHLTPFRDHLITHDHNKIKVYFQENGSECNIVASHVIISTPVYIPCEGNCYRCGNPFNFHVKTQKAMYNCKICMKPFFSCFNLRNHRITCTAKKESTGNKCVLCSENYQTESELDLHMISSHDVRSDIPIPFPFLMCNFCKKTYFDVRNHKCKKPRCGLLCTYCFRKFHSKTLQMLHSKYNKTCNCKICDLEIVSCMETEHMLCHSDKFKMVYKCINMDCSPTFLFPDEQSVKWHKILHHKQRFDKRRTYYHKVLVPKECATTDLMEIVNKYGEKKAMDLMKNTDGQEATNSSKDWCISNKDEQTDKPKNLEKTNTKPIQDLDKTKRKPIEDDDIIFMDQEIQEMSTIEIVSDDDDDDDQSGYAGMLSKVFQVSEAVKKSTLYEKPVRVKMEPSDPENDNLIETYKECNVKQEPIEACLGSAFLAYQNARNESQTDICQSGLSSQSDSCQFDTDSCYLDSSQDGDDSARELQIDISDVQSINVKTEPQELVVDGVFDSDIPDITAVKIEPEDIKQEVLECTDTTFTGKKLMSVEEFLSTTENVKMENNPKSLLKVTHKVIHNPKSLLKLNYLEQVTKTKKDSTKEKSFESRNREKIKKLYKCAKCGYTQSHKLFRIHQNSMCKLTPDEYKHTNIHCTKCDTGFGSLKTYLVHFTRHGYDLLHCPSCNVKYEILKDLIVHFQKHVKQSYVNCWLIDNDLKLTKKQHRCQTCREIVKADEYFTHWEAHLALKVEKPEPIDVDVGSVPEENEGPGVRKMLPPASLHLALQQLRSTAREKECLICQRSFTRRHDVKRHLIEHLLADAQVKKCSSTSLMLRCQICLEEFRRAEQYKFHMREHGGLPVYRCGVCDKTFSDSSNFAKHKKIHNLKVLICDICLKKFHAKTYLEKHMIMHMTTEPINCDECNKTFYTVSSLKKHKRMRHSAGTHIFRCTHCGLTFETLRQKWDHAWVVHKERKHKADCPICGLEFRKRIDVRNHAKKEHQMTLSYFTMKSDSGDENQVKIFCKINKKPVGKLVK